MRKLYLYIVAFIMISIQPYQSKAAGAQELTEFATHCSIVLASAGIAGYSLKKVLPPNGLRGIGLLDFGVTWETGVTSLDSNTFYHSATYNSTHMLLGPVKYTVIRENFIGSIKQVNLEFFVTDQSPNFEPGSLGFVTSGMLEVEAIILRHLKKAGHSINFLNNLEISHHGVIFNKHYISIKSDWFSSSHELRQLIKEIHKFLTNNN